MNIMDTYLLLSVFVGGPLIYILDYHKAFRYLTHEKLSPYDRTMNLFILWGIWPIMLIIVIYCGLWMLSEATITFDDDF
jgi:hypothetical protein